MDGMDYCKEYEREHREDNNWEYRANSEERECESLNRWLPIISRLEMNFGSYEKAKAIDYKSYIEQIFAELDQLKAEVKSKTEYIQEQREIINQYYKEIEMYKKCQGKRASKREEELKAENDNIKETFDGLFKVQYKLADNNKKLRQCLTEIKEVAEHCINQDICTFCDYSDKCYIEDEEIPTYDVCKLVLQKISEVEG